MYLSQGSSEEDPPRAGCYPRLSQGTSLSHRGHNQVADAAAQPSRDLPGLSSSRSQDGSRSKHSIPESTYAVRTASWQHPGHWEGKTPALQLLLPLNQVRGPLLSH